jgi:preprotein translocase subunit YajC
MEFIIIALSLIFGMILMYFVLRPKLKSVKERDKKTEEHNKQLQEEE